AYDVRSCPDTGHEPAPVAFMSTRPNSRAFLDLGIASRDPALPLLGYISLALPPRLHCFPRLVVPTPHLLPLGERLLFLPSHGCLLTKKGARTGRHKRWGKAVAVPARSRHAAPCQNCGS